jgi:hypothetical protein
MPSEFNAAMENHHYFIDKRAIFHRAKLPEATKWVTTIDIIM